MFTTHLYGILHQRLLHAGSPIDYFGHTCIYLFPETRNATHGCRSYFLDGHLDVLRTEVDVQFCTYTQTPATPSTFEYVSERQEIDNDIVFTQTRETFAMCIHHRFVSGMAQHHTLAFAGGTTRIKDVHQVFCIRFRSTLVHFCLMLTVLAHRQEIVHVDSRFIACVKLHIAVEHHNLLQCRAQSHHTESHIVLLLFPYKQVADLRIFQNIMHLSFRAGSIQRHSYSTYAKSTEVHKQGFRLVLSKHTDVFLYSHSQFNQCIRDNSNCFRELVPCSRNPCIRLIITMFQRDSITIFLSLLVNQDRKTSLTHSIMFLIYRKYMVLFGIIKGIFRLFSPIFQPLTRKQPNRIVVNPT